MALAIALAASCAHSPNRGHPVSGGDGSTGAKGSVRFSVIAPEAENVVLVLMSARSVVPVTWEVHGRELVQGAWIADLDLIPGEYRYFFIVDGSVTVDEGGGRLEQDDFGGKSGVVTVFQDPDGGLSTF